MNMERAWWYRFEGPVVGGGQMTVHFDLELRSDFFYSEQHPFIPSEPGATITRTRTAVIMTIPDKEVHFMHPAFGEGVKFRLKAPLIKVKLSTDHPLNADINFCTCEVFTHPRHF